jgi:acyl-CoA thioester hydrolase
LHQALSDARLEDNMSKKAGEITVRVRYAETDPWGIAHYSTYLVWFELARMEFLKELGYSFTKMGRDGVSFLMAEATCRYHAPARFDDLIVVKTSIGEVRTRSFTFEYEVRREETGELLATGRTVQVFTDLEGAVRPVPERFGILVEE